MEQLRLLQILRAQPEWGGFFQNNDFRTEKTVQTCREAEPSQTQNTRSIQNK